MFQRLTTLVGEQQELVERIDEDIEAAVGNAEDGRQQLQQAYDSATGSGSLYWKLGGVVGTFVVFFTIFLL